MSMSNIPAIFDADLPTEIPEASYEEAMSWFQGLDIGNVELDRDFASQRSLTFDQMDLALGIIKPAVRQIAILCFTFKHGDDPEIARNGFVSDEIAQEWDHSSRIADFAEEYLLGGVIASRNDEVRDRSLSGW